MESLQSVNRRRSLVVPLCLFCAAVIGQEDLSLPPRLDGAPFEARLAPAAAEREDSLEEIIVVSENEWRLPDLGSTWRLRQAAEQQLSRFETRFLPLYDAENPGPTLDLFPANREISRIGFIELFRVRFGRR